jgi:hypothetical protein
MACLPTAIRAADNENPFNKAKVGDWATYCVTITAMGKQIDGEMKMTVAAKTDKEATVKASLRVSGNETTFSDQKIDLTKPYDPTSLLGGNTDQSKIEKVADGKEKVKIETKEFDCTWIKMKTKTKFMGMEIPADVKVWLSKDVPLSGIVKMEVTSTPSFSFQFKGSGGK